MIGVPVLIFEVTTIAPPKIGCVAVSSPSTAVASVIRPEPVLTARRPAISRPSAVLGTRTAAGAAEATSEASSSALGATT